MEENKSNGISIIGMGPGTLDYLLPISLKKIEEAEILIGGSRHLSHFANLNVFKKEITSNLNELRDYILATYKEKQVVILVSGDPGFYSLLTYLCRYIDKDVFEVIPGISSVQLAFSRLAIPWHDASLISLHGKDISTLNNFLSDTKVGMLTDNVNTPQAIANVYLQAGIQGKVVYTCENLSYPNESIKKYTITQLQQELRKISNCVVIVCNA